jgi:TetR/AcrR family transcriptional regulator, transcriptional repressor for nem operon
VSKGARTRERILATAADLFHARGMNATSLGEVLRAADAGKGQFYQHFEGRDDLVMQVLERRREELAAAFAAPIETWDDLRAFMWLFLESQRAFGFERGCPVGTPAYALQPEQAAPRAELKAIFDHMRGRVEAFLAREGASEPGRLADFTLAAVQGAMLLGLLDREPETVEAVLDEAFAHLQARAARE